MKWGRIFCGTSSQTGEYHPYMARMQRVMRVCAIFGAGYELTVRGIRLLRERGVDVKINGSLTRENREDIPQLIETAKQLDSPIHIDTYMYPAGRERNEGFHYDTRLEP